MEIDNRWRAAWEAANPHARDYAYAVVKREETEDPEDHENCAVAQALWNFARANRARAWEVYNRSVNLYNEGVIYTHYDDWLENGPVNPRQENVLHRLANHYMGLLHRDHADAQNAAAPHLQLEDEGYETGDEDEDEDEDYVM
jgi:hypothetical protein